MSAAGLNVDVVVEALELAESRLQSICLLVSTGAPVGPGNVVACVEALVRERDGMAAALRGIGERAVKQVRS